MRSSKHKNKLGRFLKSHKTPGFILLVLFLEVFMNLKDLTSYALSDRYRSEERIDSIFSQSRGLLASLVADRNLSTNYRTTSGVNNVMFEKDERDHIRVESE